MARNPQQLDCERFAMFIHRQRPAAAEKMHSLVDHRLDGLGYFPSLFHRQRAHQRPVSRYFGAAVATSPYLLITTPSSSQ